MSGRHKVGQDDESNFATLGFTCGTLRNLYDCQRMILSPRHFIRFIDERAGKTAHIAFLPLDIGAYLPTTATDVQIERDYALKLLRKHRLKYEKLQLIQMVIDNGYCIRRKENHLELVYVLLDDKQIHYTLVLKSARNGQETWIVTFFRSQPAQLKSKLRRGRLVRTHLWD